MKLLQPTFAGGELAPELWGRADLQRIGSSARRCRNYVPHPTGALASRRGTEYLGQAKDIGHKVRLLPFVVSEGVAYVVELGHLYARFWFDGAPVLISGVPFSVVTPWLETEIFDVRVTQSADVMILTHRAHPPMQIRRTGPITFTCTPLAFREGPFRSVNANDGLVMASSAASGTTTITTNFDLFTAGHVGALVYLEPKALGNIKPWVQGERSPNLAVGVLRMSDGKVYKATNVSIPAGTGAYCETGNVRPTHEVGRAWDGPGDQKTFDTINYITGVEWEYQHSGYGIAQIVSVLDARTAVGTVRKVMPPEVVGGAGTPVMSWTLSGNGVTKTFTIAGASGTSNAAYEVTIDGVPTPSDPNATGGSTGPGSGTGGGIHERLPGTYDP